MLVLEVKAPRHTTLFMKLKDVYPECEFLIADTPRLHPLICLKDDCHRNSNCMGNLAKRVKYIFDQFPTADLLLLYFSYRDRPGSQRAGIFWRDFREPRYITMNRAAWERMKAMGTVYEWQLPNSLFLGPMPIPISTSP